MLAGTAQNLEPYFVMDSALAEERVLCYQAEGPDDGIFKFEQAYHLVRAGRRAAARCQL